ncbi:hypothetical protein [Streptomyces sp. H39-S7]|uniref:hypothetical protein n=1 Tax=Streptomyces sp. H39-S7 TaxID=3004357 RepID=UPI0022AF8339|nr:hypothetical protein [Streptomyces sp. H39-S7]MCZ4119812.1 hypothetical protein [Streptomyces sp. H39-S7]
MTLPLGPAPGLPDVLHGAVVATPTSVPTTLVLALAGGAGVVGGAAINYVSAKRQLALQNRQAAAQEAQFEIQLRAQREQIERQLEVQERQSQVQAEVRRAEFQTRLADDRSRALVALRRESYLHALMAVEVLRDLLAPLNDLFTHRAASPVDDRSFTSQQLEQTVREFAERFDRARLQLQSVRIAGPDVVSGTAAELADCLSLIRAAAAQRTRASSANAVSQAAVQWHADIAATDAALERFITASARVVDDSPHP